MFNLIKSMFQAPSIASSALRELEAAKRSLLEMQDAQEYAAKMVEYHQGKINRLTLFLRAEQ